MRSQHEAGVSVGSLTTLLGVDSSTLRIWARRPSPSTILPVHVESEACPSPMAAPTLRSSRGYRVGGLDLDLLATFKERPTSPKKPSPETATSTTDTSTASAETPQAPAKKATHSTQESVNNKVTAKNHTVEYNSSNNPFKGKTFEQIDGEFTERGFIKKGADPLHQRGSNIDPETNTRYFLDKGGQYADGFEPPHVDVWPPSGQKLKMMLNGDVWTPNAR